MRQASIFIAVGLLAGIVLASWLGRSPLPMLDTDVARGDGGATATSDAAIVARLAELERHLADETERRLELESTVAALSERLGSDRDVPPVAGAQGVIDLSTVDRPNPRQFFAERRALLEQQSSPDYRRDQLVAAGFAPDQAQWIVDREEQSRMDLLNAQYAARREGEEFDAFERSQEMQKEVREQLGDSAYERYLEATGQSTSASVFNVLESSPGYAAGLRGGDEIVAYGGERVFNLMELNALTFEGNPGETVAVDILRDGQPMQLYVPRGPIGISGGGVLRGPRGAVFGAAPAFVVP